MGSRWKNLLIKCSIVYTCVSLKMRIPMQQVKLFIHMSLLHIITVLHTLSPNMYYFTPTMGYCRNAITQH